MSKSQRRRSGRTLRRWTVVLLITLPGATQAAPFGPRGGAATQVRTPPPPPPSLSQHSIPDVLRKEEEDAREHTTPPTPRSVTTTSWFHVTTSSPRTAPSTAVAVSPMEDSTRMEPSMAAVSSPTALPHVGSILYHWVHSRIPSVLRYILSGNLGNLGLVTLDAMLRRAAHLPAAASFLLAYLLHVPLQHWLHAALVYGLDTIDSAEKYQRTLRGLYSTLAVSGVGTTLVVSYLPSLPWMRQHVAPSTQVLGTLYVFALWNYVALTYFVHPSASTCAAS